MTDYISIARECGATAMTTTLRVTDNDLRSKDVSVVSHVVFSCDQLAAFAVAVSNEGNAADELLRRCLDGFSSYVHGRKMGKKARDKLRADIEAHYGIRAS